MSFLSIFEGGAEALDGQSLAVLIECILGASLLAAAAHLYSRKPAFGGAGINDWDRFVVLWNALPEELRRPGSVTGNEIARALMEAASAESTRASESQQEQVFSSALGQALGVPSKKIANPRHHFQEFVQAQPQRAVAVVESLLVQWTRLTGDAKAATLMLNLPPELVAKVFQALEPADVHRITLGITRLPPIPVSLRALWFEEFMGTEKSDGDAMAQATALAVRDPKLLATILKERWLQA